MALAFVNGRVICEAGVASALRIARGKIAGIDEKPRRRDRVIDLGGAVVFPGLINAHDHLELNNFPRLKYQDCYANSIEWIQDIQSRWDSDSRLTTARAVPLSDRLWIGGLKQLLAGVTTVCHHNPFYRQLRGRFPVRVVRRYAWAHSLFIGAGRDKHKNLESTYWPDRPWIIHAAEGTDERAAAEIPRLAALGLLRPNTVIVHGVGVSPQDRRRVLGLVWCPASNDFLLGKTAAVNDFPLVGLGSDSTLSGATDLLAELQVARANGLVDSTRLFSMVTHNAAQMLGLSEVGSIAVGAPADLLMIPANGKDPLQVLLETSRVAVQLVMVGGEVRLAAATFAGLIARPGRLIVDETEKFVPAWLHRRLRRIKMDTTPLSWELR